MFFFFSPISASEMKTLTELGEIKFSVQYLSKRKALKVFIIKCENLSTSSKDLHVNAFVKVGSTGIKHAKCQLCNIGLKATSIHLHSNFPSCSKPVGKTCFSLF